MVPYLNHPDDDLTAEILTGHGLRASTRGRDKYSYDTYHGLKAEHPPLHSDLLNMGWVLNKSYDNQHFYGRADSSGSQSPAVLNIEMTPDGKVSRATHHPIKRLAEGLQRFSEHLTPDQVAERTKGVMDMTHEILSHHLEDMPEARMNSDGQLGDWHAVYSKPREEAPHIDDVKRDLESVGWRTRPHLKYALHDYLPGHELDFHHGDAGNGGHYTHFTVIHRIRR